MFARRNSVITALLTLVLAGSLFAWGGTASAASQWVSTQTPGHVQITSPDGRSAGWASINYLESHPGAIPGVTIHKEPRGSAQPASASGCNGDVCIDITGTGVIITKWGTTGYGNVGCTWANFYYEGGDYAGPDVCPNSADPGVYYDYTGPTGYYRSGSEVCNAWYRIPGFPCETIHS